MAIALACHFHFGDAGTIRWGTGGRPTKRGRCLASGICLYFMSDFILCTARSDAIYSNGSVIYVFVHVKLLFKNIYVRSYYKCMWKPFVVAAVVASCEL